jgi:5'-nucleotidase
MIMTNQSLHILITNDDGVFAPGILALAQEMRKLGKVTIVAPDHNWSASGHVKTLSRPLRVKEVELADGSKAFACDGAPSDCVALPVLGLLPEPISFVVSGINPNANLGHDVTYSGTVTAAMEAAIWNIPAIAVSLDAPENHTGALDYSTAAQVAAVLVTLVNEHGLPQGVLLNVNVPYLKIELIRREDPRGRPYFWIGGDAPTGVPEEGTDVGMIKEGYVSITPLSLDMTAYSIMDDLKKWII